MKGLCQTFLKKSRHLVLYGIFGSFSATLDFCVFTLLVQIVGFPYIFANCISVLSGITTSFFLNRNYNFKVKDHIRRRFFIFLIVGICGLLFSNIILFICIEFLDVNNLISKVMSILLVVFFQFIINKMLTFRPLKNEESIYSDARL